MISFLSFALFFLCRAPHDPCTLSYTCSIKLMRRGPEGQQTLLLVDTSCPLDLDVRKKFPSPSPQHPENYHQLQEESDFRVLSFQQKSCLATAPLSCLASSSKWPGRRRGTAPAPRRAPPPRSATSLRPPHPCPPSRPACAAAAAVADRTGRRGEAACVWAGQAPTLSVP